jgi:ferredoxin--NADP+ reductase
MDQFLKTDLKAVKILVNTKITDSIAILKFKRSFTFKAGQVIEITTDLKRIPPRMYSILSSEENEDIEILYKIVPEGELTPKLGLLESGDKIFISGPTGKFISTIDRAWFIAAGTGIAPFISMIFSGYHNNKKLIHGSRNRSGLVYFEKLTGTLSENYIPCCSAETGSDLYPGRLTDYLKGLTGLPENIKYYICGSAEMVVDTRDLLVDKGVPFQNILSEIYF